MGEPFCRDQIDAGAIGQPADHRHRSTGDRNAMERGTVWKSFTVAIDLEHVDAADQCRGNRSFPDASQTSERTTGSHVQGNTLCADAPVILYAAVLLSGKDDPFLMASTICREPTLLGAVVSNVHF